MVKANDALLGGTDTGNLLHLLLYAQVQEKAD
jgi:hypothetical protein